MILLKDSYDNESFTENYFLITLTGFKQRMLYNSITYLYLKAFIIYRICHSIFDNANSNIAEILHILISPCHIHKIS